MFEHLVSRLALQRLVVMFAIALAWRAAPLAAAIIEPISSTPIVRRTDGPYTIGYAFTVGASNVTINTLGVEDITNAGALGYGDGLLSGQQVGIWNSSGTLLGSANIRTTTGSPIINGFRYEKMAAPLTLQAGQTYYVGAQKGGAIDVFSDGGNSPNYVGTGVTVNSSQFHTTFSPLTFPNMAGTLNPTRWSGANATFVDTSYAAGTAPLLSWAGSATTTRERNDFGGTVGYQITTGSNPLAIQSLGFFDHNRDGLAQAHRVGVWDVLTGALVAQTTVPSGTAGSQLKEFTRFVDLAAPVQLQPNRAYYVGAEVTVGGDIWYHNTTAMPFEPSALALLDNVTINGGYFSLSPFGIPTSADTSSNYFFAPNLLLVETPEPASWAIFAIFGIVGACFCCRRAPKP